MNKRNSGSALSGAVGLVLVTTAMAHHSYAMFDNTRRMTVSGIVARHEWKNPHTSIWVYVKSPEGTGEYVLYTFENGSPSSLKREGWRRNSLRENDRITVEYLPLRDGRPGGHCTKVTLADGRVLGCDGIGRSPPPGVTAPRAPR
jgi:hypothetical protein